jgi:hypothetical protein
MTAMTEGKGPYDKFCRETWGLVQGIGLKKFCACVLPTAL